MPDLRRSRPQILCAALALCMLPGVIRAQGQSTDEKQCNIGKLKFTGQLCKIAEIVCVENDECLSDRIQKLGDMDDRCGPPALVLRQEITEMVLTTSLQVDGFLAEIDSENAHIRAVRDNLTDRQNRAISRSSLGSAIGTGGGAVGSGLALAATTAATVGSWVGAVSGVIGTAYGFLGYFEQSGQGPKGCFPIAKPDPKSPHKEPKKCESVQDYCDEIHPPSGCSPAMLYRLFDSDHPRRLLFHSDYEPAIARYLNSRGSTNLTRRDQLIADWGDDVSDDKKIAPLIVSNDRPQKLSVDDLNGRANKLADLRAVVSRLNRNLGEITAQLAPKLRCSHSMPKPSAGLPDVSPGAAANPGALPPEP